MSVPASSYTDGNSPTPTSSDNGLHNIDAQVNQLAARASQSAAEQSRQVLADLDNAKLSLFHVKTIMVAGSGFLCDAYDLQCIGMITNLLGRIYYPDWTYWSAAQCQANSYFQQGQVPGYLQPQNQANATKYLKCGSNAAKSAVFGADQPNHVPSAMPLGINFAINGVALCGTLAGQLVFGFLGDRFGRRSMFVLSLTIMIVFAFLQGFTLGSGTPSFIWSLCWFRFFLGFGIGGDYPLAATLMSEYSGKGNRGMLVSAVFAMQGTGYLLASGMVALWGGVWKATGANVDYLWRIILMFGAVPTLASLYSRIGLPESPRFTLFNRGQAANMVSDMRGLLVEGQTQEEAALAMARYREQQFQGTKATVYNYGKFFRNYGLILMGTAGSWFFLDIVFYSQGLYQNVIYQNIGWVASSYTLTPADECLQLAKAQTYVNLASTIPGYWFTVFTIEILGRWKIQMGGFAMIVLFMSILAGLYNTLFFNVPVFIALYCMTFFFANWGPNSTTFVVPAEVFPSNYRTLGHGFSAACGKAGSIIGTFGFKYMTLYTGDLLPAPAPAGTQSLAPALGLLAGCAGLGLLCTLLVPETRNRTLEEMGGDVYVDRSAESDELANMHAAAANKDVDYYAQNDKQFNYASEPEPAAKQFAV